MMMIIDQFTNNNYDLTITIDQFMKTITINQRQQLTYRRASIDPLCHVQKDNSAPLPFPVSAPGGTAQFEQCVSTHVLVLYEDHTWSTLMWYTSACY